MKYSILEATGRRKSKMLVSITIVTLTLNTCLLAQVAASSYLDLLPTAKLALNKLQQTLAPATTSAPVVASNVASQSNSAQYPSATTTTISQVINNETNERRNQPYLAAPNEPDRPQTTTTTTTTSTTTLATTTFAQSQQVNDNSQPSNDIDSDNQPSRPSQETPFESRNESDSTLVVSSTAATDYDPSTETSDNSKQDFSEEVSEKSTSSPTEANIEQSETTTTAATTTTTTTTPEPTPQRTTSEPEPSIDANDINQLPALIVDSEKPNTDEASIRETELAAVAAVDASIGFGTNGDLFGATTDTCYDEYGNARYCEPEFENIAFERPIEVSSECGQPASRFCTAYANENNDIIRNCHICDAKHPKKRHPAAYLSDLNDPNNPTCWVSAPMSLASSQQSDIVQRDNVSLTLNLGKMYEITYVSVQFCSARPDSMAIYKSNDFGSSWQAYQYYSSNCRQTYNRPTSSSRAAGDLSAICTNYNSNNNAQQQQTTPTTMNSTINPTTTFASHWNSNRVAFSTLEGARGKLSDSLGSSAAPQGASGLPTASVWTSATNVRIVLDRYATQGGSPPTSGGSAAPVSSAMMMMMMLNNKPKSSSQLISGNRIEQVSPGGVVSRNNRQLSSSSSSSSSATNETSSSAAQNNVHWNNSNGANQQHILTTNNQLINPSDTYNYAIADLVVGGRCKCNGHASRCTHSSEGRLQCDCRHNTAGRDCERCAPFHFDRPWKQATQLDANPCQPCNCNGHSRKCRFDPELYELSGSRSGGVCINCRDNTAGRHCHYCKEGFTRDLSKPMTDKEACRECDCHPLGSLGRVCNQTTGQCPCKEGVTGLQCTRCAPGYQQSSSPSEPCIKLPENDINYEPALVVDSESQSSSSPAVSVNNGEADSTTDTVSIGDSSGDGSVQPNGLDATPNPQATPVGHRTNIPNKPYLGDDDNGSLRPPPPDNDFSDTDDQPPTVDDGYGMSLIARKRAQQRQQWLLQNQYQSMYHPRHHKYQHPTAGDETASVDEPNVRGAEDQELSYLGGARSRNHATYMDMDDDLASGYVVDNGGYSRPMYNRWPQTQDGQQHRDYRRRQQMSHRNRPTSNVDESYDDHMNSLSGMDSAGYGPSADDATFNLISPRRRMNPMHAGSRSRKQQQGGVATGGARRRPASMDDESQQQPVRHQIASPVSLSCGDCQNSTRRMSSRQFCHLDYAIKATILSRHRAADWTRFDVEIIDIFKSPQLRSNSMIMSGNNYIDNMVQSDEPMITNKSSTNNNKMSSNAPKQAIFSADQRSSMLQSNNNNQQQQPPTPNVHHRLRVGTVQPIWIPTEDLSCNCPRLKPRSTYLLMGLVDSKENSANSIQLDRHSVALEWRSILQEKLIRYQRRYARGRCL